MNKKSTTYAILGFSILAALLAALLYVYLFVSLSHFKQERLALADEIANKNVAPEKEGDDTIRDHFIKSGEEAAFVSKVESACRSFALTCETRSVEESEPDSGHASLQVFRMISVPSGSFANIMAFLGYLEKSPYPIEIGNISFQKNDAGWQGVFEISAAAVPK